VTRIDLKEDQEGGGKGKRTFIFGRKTKNHLVLTREREKDLTHCYLE